jgi:RNase H-like domain found in reverse transcriptase
MDTNGDRHPCAYLSKSLTKEQRNYNTEDRELLAIVWALKKWRHYIQRSGHTMTVLSDHDNLRHFKVPQTIGQRMAQWTLYFSECSVLDRRTPFPYIWIPKISLPDFGRLVSDEKTFDEVMATIGHRRSLVNQSKTIRHLWLTSRRLWLYICLNSISNWSIFQEKRTYMLIHCHKDQTYVPKEWTMKMSW